VSGARVRHHALPKKNFQEGSMDEFDIINKLRPEMTFAEIAEKLGMSAERVRQIEKQALGKARLNCIEQGIRAGDYIDVQRDDMD
jgi:hypothetical protein